MPPHKNTHLQTAQSRPADQGLQESIFYPNPTIIKSKKPPFLQKIKTYIIYRQRHIDNEKEALGGNMRLASCGVQGLNSSTVFQINFSAGLTVLCPEIPNERQAPKRCSLV
jgi:hypothetical protein